MENKQLFIAIDTPIPSESLHLYENFKVRFPYDKISWATFQNLHLTLFFIGETPAGQIEAITECMDNCLLNIPSFTLEAKGVKLFGYRYAPKIIWIGVEENPLLRTIEKNLRKALMHLNLKGQIPSFTPHITIGRIQKIDDKKRFLQEMETYNSIALGRIPINTIHLYESISDKTGVKYHSIKRYELNGVDFALPEVP